MPDAVVSRVPWHVVEVQRFPVLRPRDGVGRRDCLDETLNFSSVTTSGRLLVAADDDWSAVTQQVHVT